jgi:hypothetical protein
VAALTTREGQRSDTVPFVRWLTGEVEFHALGTSAGLTARVLLAGTSTGICSVRMAHINTSMSCGLLVPSGRRNRPSWLVTERGRAFAAAHGWIAPAGP